MSTKRHKMFEDYSYPAFRSNSTMIDWFDQLSTAAASGPEIGKMLQLMERMFAESTVLIYLIHKVESFVEFLVSERIEMSKLTC